MRFLCPLPIRVRCLRLGGFRGWVRYMMHTSAHIWSLWYDIHHPYSQCDDIQCQLTSFQRESETEYDLHEIWICRLETIKSAGGGGGGGGGWYPVVLPWNNSKPLLQKVLGQFWNNLRLSIIYSQLVKIHCKVCLYHYRISVWTSCCCIAHPDFQFLHSCVLWFSLPKQKLFENKKL
jgi:hypothetical protein